jgi:hypothetical protein
MPKPEQIAILVGGLIFAIGFVTLLHSPLVAPATLSGSIETTLDSDFDGLSNYEETELTFTDPYNADTDGDGAKDGFEVYIRESDPLSP